MAEDGFGEGGAVAMNEDADQTDGKEEKQEEQLDAEAQPAEGAAEGEGAEGEAEEAAPERFQLNIKDSDMEDEQFVIVTKDTTIKEVMAAYGAKLGRTIRDDASLSKDHTQLDPAATLEQYEIVDDKSSTALLFVSPPFTISIQERGEVCYFALVSAC